MNNGDGNILKFKPQHKNPKDTSKIYLACHPKDFELFFEGVSDELLSVTNSKGITCTVWYRDGNSVLSENGRAELLSSLSGMQLMVVPVTRELLCDPEAVLEVEIAYAKQHNIPILPLLSDVSLIPDYSRPENFGDLQFLNKNDPDTTALPYKKKLEDFLKSVLVGDELRKKVQAAFDAYIFLSYRKKDRVAAQELMRLIHQNEFCRDIAIWYDEFLAPGENFTEAIRSALEKSHLFALVVTPNITEPHNYVLEHEYPMAVEAKKQILPLESITTDRDALKKCFEDLPEVTDAHDRVLLSDALLEKLKSIATRENDTPEHNYLIALAYLNGIDVEVDSEKAEQLLLSAANDGLPEAMTTLANMYESGKGVKRDYEKSLLWLEEACGVYIQLSLKDPAQYRNNVISTLSELAANYLNFGHNKKCERYAREAIMHCKIAFKETGKQEYAAEALKNTLVQISAKVNLNLESQKEFSLEDSNRFSLSLHLEAEKLFDSFELTGEYSESLKLLIGLIYSQISVYYASFGELEKSGIYRKKADSFAETPDEIANITNDMLEILSTGVSDYNRYLDLIHQFIQYYETEFAKQAEAQKQEFLCEMIVMSSTLFSVTASIAENLCDADIDDLEAVLEKIHLIFRIYVSMIEQCDLDSASNTVLNDLAASYHHASNIERLCENTDEAMRLTQLQLDIAKRSFELYPTEKALREMVMAAHNYCSQTPPSDSTVELLLYIEKAFEPTYKDSTDPLAGHDCLVLIYQLLSLSYDALENYTQAEEYAEKHYKEIKRKAHHTKELSDELDSLRAHLDLCEAWIKSNHDLERLPAKFNSIKRRYLEFIRDPQQYRIMQKVYTEICVNYCEALFLQALVYYELDDLDKVNLNFNEYINTANQILPRCNSKQRNTISERMAQINALCDDGEE